MLQGNEKLPNAKEGGVLPSVWVAKIALPLVEVYIRGYWPPHEQTKQNTIIDLPRQRFGEYNFASKLSQPPLFTYAYAFYGRTEGRKDGKHSIYNCNLSLKL